MRWAKDIFQFFINDKEDKNYIGFEENNNLLVLGRIRLISIAVIFMTVFLLYFDLVVLRAVVF